MDGSGNLKRDTSRTASLSAVRGLVKLCIMVVILVSAGEPILAFFRKGGWNANVGSLLQLVTGVVVSTLTIGVGAALSYDLFRRIPLPGVVRMLLSTAVTCVVSILLTKLITWVIVIIFQALGMILGLLFVLLAIAFTSMSAWGLLLTLSNVVSKRTLEDKLIMQMFINEGFHRKLGG